MRGVHYNKRPRRRIDDEIAGHSDGADQSRDQANWLTVWVNAAIDFLDSPAQDTVIAPRACGDRRLLQDEQIITTPTGSFTHPGPQIVPGNQINGLENVGNPEMVRLTYSKRIDPPQQVTARPEHASTLATDSVNVALGHWRQFGAPALSSSLVAEFQTIQHTPVLWIEEHERRAAVRQRAQELERIAALRHVWNHRCT